MTRGELWPVAGLLVLVAAMFGDVLFTRGAWVPSSASCDLESYFAANRAYGFGELGQGRVPLWNPHVFCGYHYLGSFQPALLYPINLIYLALPLAKALTLDIMFHVWLCGVFLYAWGRYRGLERIPAWFAACTFMFGGSFFLHVLAGHLTLLAAFAWSPLVFLAVDGLLSEPKARWFFACVAAVAMQSLAGFPQAVFCTLSAAGVYAAMRVVRERGAGIPACGLGSLMFVAGAVLLGLAVAAAQWLPGLAAVRDSYRAANPHQGFAGSYSFPPENLITALAPAFFGNFVDAGYWGRAPFVWEACVFSGITGFVFAVFGALEGGRHARYAVPMFLLLLVAALGEYTPVFPLLYRAFPMLGLFRAPSRYMIPAMMFGALLCGAGLQRVGFEKRANAGHLLFAVLVAAILFGAALVLRRATLPGGSWETLVRSMGGADEVSRMTRRATPEQAGAWAARGLTVASAVSIGLCALVSLLWRRRSGGAIFAVVALGVLEVFAFARWHREQFELRAEPDARIAALCRRDLEERRICDLDLWSNRVFAAGGYGALGYEPMAIGRCMEFVFDSLDDPGSKEPKRSEGFNRMLRMLRCDRVIYPGDTGAMVEVRDALPRFYLAGKYEIENDRAAILRRLKEPDMDPRTMVILESKPIPEPAPGAVNGTIAVERSRDDDAVVDVALSAPGLLVMTDAFSGSWTARALSPGPQERYEVMPANFAVRAIPLAAGTHRLEIAYSRRAYHAGMAVSMAALAVLVAGEVLYLRRRRKRRTAQSFERIS